MLNKKSTFFPLFLLLGAIVFSYFGCANQQPPHGGPKDVTPPRLLKASPPNMTRHFNAKVVKLDFDEYFKLNNQYTEITMSPTPDKQPDIKRKDKSLVITFKDTLQKNTTYVINFGKAIQDVNEGNTLLNFTYVFSTGGHIDSLSVSGTVVNSISQKREKDITVMLFPADKDTAYFGKKKPNIYATTDTAGNFSMNNLHEGDYRIYALKEDAPNKIYDNEKELIGFLKKPIHLYSDTSDIQMTLFRQDPPKFRVTEKRFDENGRFMIVFNKRLDNPSLKIVYPPALDNQKIVEITKTRDTAFLYSRNMDFDSLRVAILDNGKPIDSISHEKQRKEAFKQIFTYSFNLSSGYLLKPNNNLEITTNYPIDSFDESLITLTEDSSAVGNVTITKDTAASSRKLIVKYRWKQDSKYAITIDDNALTSIYGFKNKHAYKKFQQDKENNYGNMTLHVTVPDTSKSYIVEIYIDPKNVLSRTEITKNTTIDLKNYFNGKYYIRVIYDANKNGKWDTGNVKKREYPENIWIDPVQITLRPNWDDEEKLDIPREQVIP